MKAKLAPDKSAAGKKRIYIVEDHPVLREGVMRAIDREPDLCVCGWSDSVAKAFTAISATKPDVALIDLTLPGRSGLELIKDLRSLGIVTAMIVLSMHDEALFAERALRAGARGYLMKHEETNVILKAIRHVLKGGVFVSPEMSEHILRRISPHGAELKSPMAQLTDREFEVLHLFGHGLTTKEIAKQLRLSPKTVAVHRSNIKTKLHLKTVAEIIRVAVVYDISRPKARPDRIKELWN